MAAQLLEQNFGLPVSFLHAGFKHIFKNSIYTVKECLDKLTLISYDNIEITIDVDKLKHFTLGYAITVHSCQGLTISEPYCIHEHHKMSKNILYTAISRGRDINNLSFHTDKNYHKDTKYTENSVQSKHFSYSDMSPQ